MSYLKSLKQTDHILINKKEPGFPAFLLINFFEIISHINLIPVLLISSAKG